MSEQTKVDVFGVLESASERIRNTAPLVNSKEQAEICKSLGAEVAEARAAVAELVEAARKLRLDREGITNATTPFCAPVLDVADLRAFSAALARMGVTP